MALAGGEPLKEDSAVVRMLEFLAADILHREPNFDPLTAATFITAGSEVVTVVGQKAVLLNTHGALCIIAIDGVQREVNTKDYVPGHVTFTYEVLVND
jgi:hypothetical protein